MRKAVEAAKRAALRVWKLRHTRVKDELNALVDVGIHRTPGITGADIAAWPCSVGIFCKFTSSHWPMGSEDMDHFGVSFLELLTLFEQWAGHWLLCEKLTRPHVWANCPILIPSVPVSEEIEIRHGCQFIGSLVRALTELLGGLGRFLPSGVGSHMSRLRHLGWNQCSHGTYVKTIGILSSSVP